VEAYVIGIAYQYLGQPANAYLVLKPGAPELSLGVAADTGRKKGSYAMRSMQSRRPRKLSHSAAMPTILE